MTLIKVDPTKLAEINRKKWQAERDQALQAMTHELSDGSVVQIRPQDMPTMQLAVAKGTNQDWVLADNTVRDTTPAELQECIDAAIVQAEAIWKTYTDKIK